MSDSIVARAVQRLIDDVRGLRTDVDTAERTPGPTGLQGEPGTDGALGSMGPAGAPGEPGPAGAGGETGADGGAGPIGPTGQPGRDGPGGLPGRDGEPGAAGPMGTRGERGPAGRDGADGAQGPSGRDGVDGQSITKLALKGRELFATIGGKRNKVGTIPAPAVPFGFGDTGGGGAGTPSPRAPVTVTGDYVVVDAELIIVDATAADVAIDLSNPHLDKYKFKRKDGSNFVVGFGVAVIDGDTTFKLLSQHETVTLERDGLVWWIT